MPYSTSLHARRAFERSPTRWSGRDLDMDLEALRLRKMSLEWLRANVKNLTIIKSLYPHVKNSQTRVHIWADLLDYSGAFPPQHQNITNVFYCALTGQPVSDETLRLGMALTAISLNNPVDYQKFVSWFIYGELKECYRKSSLDYPEWWEKLPIKLYDPFNGLHYEHSN